MDRGWVVLWEGVDVGEENSRRAEPKSVYERLLLSIFDVTGTERCYTMRHQEPKSRPDVRTRVRRDANDL